MSGLSDFIEIGFGETTKEDNLLKHTIYHFDYKINLLNDYLGHIKDAFSDFVARQNIRSNFRLQISVLILSFIATIATVLNLIINWNELKKIVQAFFK